MDRLAQALIRAMQYISERTADCTADDDIKQLESAASVIGQCTEEEKRVLKRVAVEIGFPDWPREMGMVE